jgi:hypothetical protein
MRCIAPARNTHSPRHYMDRAFGFRRPLPSTPHICHGMWIPVKIISGNWRDICRCNPKEEVITMAKSARRIGVQEAREHMDSDPNTLLVCGYDEEEKFEQNHLEGAMSLKTFMRDEQSVPKDREIIFYCA